MKKNINIIILTIITVMLYASLNFGHPVTPAFLKEVDIPQRFFGILFSTMAFSLVLFSPFWGNKGDNYGRKYIVAIGIAGYGIGQIVFGIGETITVILTGRIISGVFAAAIFSNLIASFSEIATDETRARNISIVTSTGIISGAIGYYIGGKLGVLFSPSQTLIIQGITAIGIAIIILIFYPKTAIISKERRSFIKNMALIKTIDENVIYLMFTVLFWTMAQNNTAKFFDVYLANIGLSSAQIGYFIMMSGMVAAVFIVIFIPRITKKWELLSILKFLMVFSIIALIITFTVNSRTIMYVSYLIFIILIASYLAVEQTFITKNITSHYGTIIGVRESFKSIGLVSGPLLITFIFDDVNSNVFYFNAFIFLIALLFMLKFIKMYSK